VQAELLKEFRQMGDEESEIKKIREDAIVVSINGVAQGMKNSG
jgi:phosphoenolpyruvate carboxylase